MCISASRQRKWKWSHNLNWYPNVCKMPFVMSQKYKVLYQAFHRMTTKEFIREAICYLCSDLPCSCCEGSFCPACWKLRATQSHASRPVDWHWNYGFSQPFFRGPWVARDCGTALQSRHSAIISPNTPYQLVISLSLVLMWRAWLQVWSRIQQRQFIILSFRSVIYSFRGLLCPFMGSARILSSTYKVQYLLFFSLCMSNSFSWKKERGKMKTVVIMRRNIW